MFEILRFDYFSLNTSLHSCRQDALFKQDLFDLIDLFFTEVSMKTCFLVTH